MCPPGGAQTSGAYFPIETCGANPCCETPWGRVKMLANGPGKGGFQVVSPLVLLGVSEGQGCRGGVVCV